MPGRNETDEWGEKSERKGESAARVEGGRGAEGVRSSRVKDELAASLSLPKEAREPRNADSTNRSVPPPPVRKAGGRGARGEGGGGAGSSRRWSVAAARNKRVGGGVCRLRRAGPMQNSKAWWGDGAVRDPPTGQTTP